MVLCLHSYSVLGIRSFMIRPHSWLHSRQVYVPHKKSFPFYDPLLFHPQRCQRLYNGAKDTIIQYLKQQILCERLSTSKTNTILFSTICNSSEFGQEPIFCHHIDYVFSWRLPARGCLLNLYIFVFVVVVVNFLGLLK